MSLSVSVIIPTLNAESEIGGLLTRLMGQTVAPKEILVVDSSSDDDTELVVSDLASSALDTCVRFESIKRSEFNHGGTRRLAVSRTSGDVALLMTQDALPADDELLERLLAPFDDSAVAIVSGRQIAKPDATRAEQLIREFNYPDESRVYVAEDLKTCGLKTYFTSDVCCAYRRTAYEAVGGFPQFCNTSEDMYVAIRAIAAGWKIAYAADARVLHSHNLTPRQQYQRNWQVGYFLESQAPLLSGISEVGEGARLAKHVVSALLSEGRIVQSVGFAFDCMARVIGNRVGRRSFKRGPAQAHTETAEQERQV